MAEPLPPGVSAETMAANPGAIQADRRQRMGVHRRAGRQLPRSLPDFQRRHALQGPRRGRTFIHRAGAGDRQGGQHVRRSPVAGLARQELRLWRRGAGAVGIGRRRHESDEPHPRGERKVRLRAGRTGGQLLRPLQLPPDARAETVAGRAGPGLGQRDGERAGSRRGLHAVWRSLHDAVRYGSRAGERRGGADGDGRDAGQQHLAVVQVRLRPVRGWHLLAVEFRHRHQDGHLAHAGSGRLPAIHDHLRTRRGH